jgi:hypothetical protein
MREFERRLDEDGRTSQDPTTLSPDDRNVGYFEEAKQMVLRFDQSEAQLDKPPEARRVEPEEARPSEEDQAQEVCRSIAENLLQRERRKASPSSVPAEWIIRAPKRVRWTGDTHDPKTVILKLNEDKLKKVQAQHWSLRLTQVEGLALEQAIGSARQRWHSTILTRRPQVRHADGTDRAHPSLGEAPG